MDRQAIDTTPAAGPLHLAVHADDPLAREAVLLLLQEEVHDTRVVPLVEADIVLLYVREVTPAVVAMMRDGAMLSTRTPQVVAVTTFMAVELLPAAAGYGLAEVLRRGVTGIGDLVEALRRARHSRSESGAARIARLTPVLESLACMRSAGAVTYVSEREVEVLRLLAEGLDTVEIARRLNYSERTIKSIVHTMTKRLGLRNRAHAVAYAFHAGLL